MVTRSKCVLLIDWSSINLVSSFHHYGQCSRKVPRSRRAGPGLGGSVGHPLRAATFYARRGPVPRTRRSAIASTLPRPLVHVVSCKGGLMSHNLDRPFDNVPDIIVVLATGRTWRCVSLRRSTSSPCEAGTSYTATCWTLLRYRIVGRSTARELVEIEPKAIKKKLLGVLCHLLRIVLLPPIYPEGSKKK